MFNLKLKCKWQKIKIDLEYGTNNSSDLSVKADGSIMSKLIKWSLGLSTLFGIWKYLIIPLLF